MLFGDGNSSTSAGPKCSSCGCFEHDHDHNGSCLECGRVCDQLIVSNDATFNADGKVQGSTLDIFRPNASGGGGIGIGRSYDRYAVGRSEIQKITSALGGLNNTIVSKAEAVYRLAVTNDFVKAGRPVRYVAGCCVYVACRKSRFPILLMDISSYLQINLFKLGRLVMKLCKALHQKLGTCPLLAAYGSNEYVDPSLYVARFARKLDFGADEHKISSLACLVLKKMQNDWIQCGRHPAGLFGASIIIAARLLGHNRTHKEVARHVFIGGVTISKRVVEFAHTTAGGMTLQDFERAEFGKSANPPAFVRAALKKLEESEVPTPDVQKWLDKGDKTSSVFASTEHENDEPLDDSELCGYILDDSQNAAEIKLKEDMYKIQYSTWEIEKAEKAAEKALIKAEKKANRKRRKEPKNVEARKKHRWNEASVLAINDPHTGPVLEKAGQAVSVTPHEIVSADNVKDEIKLEKQEPADITMTETQLTANSTAQNDDFDSDEMSDIEFGNDTFNTRVSDESYNDYDEYDFADDIGW